MNDSFPIEDKPLNLNKLLGRCGRVVHEGTFEQQFDRPPASPIKLHGRKRFAVSSNFSLRRRRPNPTWSLLHFSLCCNRRPPELQTNDSNICSFDYILPIKETIPHSNNFNARSSLVGKILWKVMFWWNLAYLGSDITISGR